MTESHIMSDSAVAGVLPTSKKKDDQGRSTVSKQSTKQPMESHLDKQEGRSESKSTGWSSERHPRGARGNGISEGDSGEKTCN